MIANSYHGVLFILSLFSHHVGAQSTTNDAVPSSGAGDDMYGLGIRLGIYFQALAFLIGFANVLRLDPKSQFSGVVIAFTILVKWFSRLNERSISAAELWVGLALLLLVSAPGMWLLFFTLEVQRRKWYRKVRDKRQAFAEITKGQTLNILQALVVFLWTVVANSWFSYYLIGRNQAARFPPATGSKNVIWLGIDTSMDSSWIKVVMITQAALGTVFTAIPAFVYVLGIAFAVISYWFPDGRVSDPLLNTEDELDKGSRLETKRWAYGFGTVLFIMCLCLLLSIELTIDAADLKPAKELRSPGQLLPLIAGSISCLSSAADAFGNQIPQHLEMHRHVISHVGRQHTHGLHTTGYMPLQDMHDRRFSGNAGTAGEIRRT